MICSVSAKCAKQIHAATLPHPDTIPSDQLGSLPGMSKSAFLPATYKDLWIMSMEYSSNNDDCR